jgi:hypothetical protein
MMSIVDDSAQEEPILIVVHLDRVRAHVATLMEEAHL